MEYAGKPLDVKVTGEASSLAVEWSHDVCRFLLKWLPGLELKLFKSSQVSREGKSTYDKSLGKYTQFNLIFHFIMCLYFFCQGVYSR